MVKVRISGAKQSTDVFFNVVKDLVQSNQVKCSFVDKEYPNMDGTIRRYFDFDVSNTPTDIKAIEDKVLLGLRISGTEEEVERMLRILKQMGVLFGKPQLMKRKKGEASLMVQLMDKNSVAKNKILTGNTGSLFEML